VFFGEVRVTSAHTDSIAAVQGGLVDVACIDAVVLALLRRARPAAVRGLRPVMCTSTALAPPYVISARASAALRQVVQQALHDAARDPKLATARRALLLDAFAFLPPGSYAELEAFEEPALEAGYFELPAPARSPLTRLREPGRERRSCCG
jgi:ABC-type phosphate/phosphonate transport system substrate-binding protein